MPPKDDDDPASTKEVVTKKQKQLLNREELDLNLIAESLGAYVVSEDIKSLTGDPKEIIKRIFGSVPRVTPGADPRDFLPDPESKVRNPKPKKPTPGGPRVNPGASPFDLSKQAKDAKFFDKLGTPSERAAAAQQAAIDMQADKASGRTTPGGRPSPSIRQPPTPKKSFSGLVKSIKNVKPPSVGQAVRGAGRLVAPATAAIDIAGRKSRGQSTVQSVAAPAGGWTGASLASKATAKTLAPLLAAPFPGARPLYGLTVAGAGLAGYYGGAAAVDQFFKPKVKPVKDPKVKPVKDPKVEPTPQPEVEPKEKPTQKPNRPGSGLRTPSRINVGSKSQTPGSNQSPSGLTAAQTAALGGATALTTATALKGKKGRGGRLPRIGLPGYRGKIGRRSNPQ